MQTKHYVVNVNIEDEDHEILISEDDLTPARQYHKITLYRGTVVYKELHDVAAVVDLIWETDEKITVEKVYLSDAQFYALTNGGAR